MRRNLLFATITILLLAFAASAAAQANNQQERPGIPLEGSILRTMSTGGCDSGWLSQVMEINDITISKLQRLPAGTPILMPLCDEAPSALIAQRTAMIFEALAAEKKVREAAEQLRQASEINRLSSDENEALKTEIGQLKEKITLANTTANGLRAQLAASKKETMASNFWICVIAIAMFIVIAAAALMVLDWRKTARQLRKAEEQLEGMRSFVSVPREIGVHNGHTPGVFKLAEVRIDPASGKEKTYWICPKCDPKRLAPVSREQVQPHWNTKHGRAKIHAEIMSGDGDEVGGAAAAIAAPTPVPAPVQVIESGSRANSLDFDELFKIGERRHGSSGHHE